ncbi:MAG: hypothetical protein FJX73_10800 [Armatimonadetes bacterium]|nr:hypothetical protein [Armatimonadota bacterium]
MSVSPGRRGFSFLDGLIAIAVIAAVLGLAVPGYLGYIARRQIQNAAFLLQGDLRLAQQAAIAQSGDGPRVEVCLRPDGYDIYRVAFRSPVDRNPADLERGPTVKVANAGQEYRGGIGMNLTPGDLPCLIDDERVALAFAGSGAPYPDGARRSVQLGFRGQTLVVDVEPGTGLATVRP